VRNNSKGFTPILIILVIGILGVIGYFAYKDYSARYQISAVPSLSLSPLAISSPTPEAETSLPVVAVTNGQKDTIDAGETVGTMIVPTGWQFVSTDDDSVLVGETIKNVDIKNGDYAIQISTFGSGRAYCDYELGASQQGKRSVLINSNDYVYFKDQDGTEYFRQKLQNSSNTPNTLDVCSNAITSKGSDGSDKFGGDEAAFGNISYKIPANPDPKILNEMDDMVASFKTIP